jgi:integrase
MPQLRLWGLRMQHGSLIKNNRKHGPDVWQFRWSEKGPQGKRIYRKRVIGSVGEYSDADAARRAVAGMSLGFLDFLT